jgi:hypothetical protein
MRPPSSRLNQTIMTLRAGFSTRQCAASERRPHPDRDVRATIKAALRACFGGKFMSLPTNFQSTSSRRRTAFQLPVHTPPIPPYGWDRPNGRFGAARQSRP